MLFLTNLKARLKAALVWAGDDGHRRAVAGVLAAALAWGVHAEIDSAVVDSALLIVIPAVLSMWTGRTSKVEGEQ